MGKQAWRLLQNPSSLWSRLFRGLYFHSTDFWHATKGHRPSWGWQSLLLGRDSILPQLQWSVGNGKNIFIRKDKWLFRGIIGGPANRGEPEMVADFLHSKQSTWNVPLLRRSFDDQKVEDITAIHLGPMSTTDQIIWTGTPTRESTVKSSYHYLQHTTPPNDPNFASTSSHTPSRLWRQVWTAKTSSKIQIFLWSLYHNALATRDNLYRRHILPSPVYQLCPAQHPETTEHLFLLCPWTQSIWSHPKVNLDISVSNTNRIDA